MHKTSTRTRIVVAAVAAGLVGSAAWGLTGVGQAHAVQLEATSSAGENPFMTPVGEDQAGLTPPPGNGGERAGDTAGLYGDTGGAPPCDAQALVTNLWSDGAKAQAWADVFGMGVDQIPGFVGTLSPVLLRSDTAVTNHGYTDGEFKPYPAVLQAGTAVFVNDKGEPAVKCFNGNPLTEGEPGDDFAGSPWSHFQAGAVTSVQPGGPVTTVVNVNNGKQIKRDPVRDAIARQAQAKAAAARAEAGKARTEADRLEQVAKDQEREADRLQTLANRSQEEFEIMLRTFGPRDPRTIAAKQAFDTAVDQARFAKSKAKNDRTNADLADKQAKQKDQDAKGLEKEAEQRQKEADDAARGRTVAKTKPEPTKAKPADEPKQEKAGLGTDETATQSEKSEQKSEKSEQSGSGGQSGKSGSTSTGGNSQ